MSTYNAVRTAQGWVQALKGLDRPSAEALSAARRAAEDLDRRPMTAGAPAGPLTELRAEIAAGEIRALEAQPGDPHYLPGWSVRATAAAERAAWEAREAADNAVTEAEDAAQDLPQLAELMAAAPDVSEPEAPAWTGWSAPAPALPEEDRAGLVDRVAGDLDGAADLVTALAAELGVPKAVGGASSLNIARACAGGAATLRALVPVVRGVEPAGERETGTSADLSPGELAYERDRLRRELAEREAELEESGEALTMAQARANEAEAEMDRRVTDLSAELAKTREHLRQAQDRAVLDPVASGRSAVVAVLKALGTWAPGFEQMTTEELGAEAEKVARGVLNEQQTTHAAHQSLLRELRTMPGMVARSGPLVDRVRAVLAEADRAIEAHQDCSDEWEGSEALAEAQAYAERLSRDLAGVRAQRAALQERNTTLADQLDGMEAELAKVRRGQPVPPPVSVTTDLRPPAPSAPRTIEGVTIPPVRPTPGITDAPAVAPDGQEPPL